MVAKDGLGPAFIDPALKELRKLGVDVRFGARLRGIDFAGDRAARLNFGEDFIDLGEADSLVLAVPPWSAAELIPGLVAPDEFRAILNAHFRVPPPEGQPVLLGMVGSLSEWLFAFHDRLSVTISGADRLMEQPAEDLARRIWDEVAAVTGLGRNCRDGGSSRRNARPSPRRPATGTTSRRETQWRNLLLAGDWTATGLPATIEGAIRSGYRAADRRHRAEGLQDLNARPAARCRPARASVASSTNPSIGRIEADRR